MHHFDEIPSHELKLMGQSQRPSGVSCFRDTELHEAFTISVNKLHAAFFDTVGVNCVQET